MKYPYYVIEVYTHNTTQQVDRVNYLSGARALLKNKEYMEEVNRDFPLSFYKIHIVRIDVSGYVQYATEVE